MTTLYRRPLPPGLLAFSSPEGRAVFHEALESGGMEGYFPLAEQFHTQADPAFCGLGSLVVALNALGIDPGRLWKGPWRWYSEDLLDCCLPLERVREQGVTLDELACLARCNGTRVSVTHADEAEPEAWQRALGEAARAESVLLVAYDRQTLGQTGSGHFSPVGGYHAQRGLVLVLDVARFKYPPYWVPSELLRQAMLPEDPQSGRARGWLSLRASEPTSSLGFSMRCVGGSWRDLWRRIDAALDAMRAAPDVSSFARALAPLTANVELREPDTAQHAETLARTRATLQSSPVYPAVRAAVGTEHAERMVLLLWALADRLPAAQRAWLGAEDATLRGEVAHLRAQLSALEAAPR